MSSILLQKSYRDRKTRNLTLANITCNSFGQVLNKRTAKISINDKAYDIHLLAGSISEGTDQSGITLAKSVGKEKLKVVIQWCWC